MMLTIVIIAMPRNSDLPSGSNLFGKNTTAKRSVVKCCVAIVRTIKEAYSHWKETRAGSLEMIRLGLVES